ncbi:MAG: hypothetical protein DRJ56_02055 [Thermoprotei archaeon]|nr:MAG: hypothetical protein DRJ56_02055 [Thermoprotei archaeon]
MNVLKVFNRRIETDIYVACLPPPDKYCRLSLAASLAISLAASLALAQLVNVSVVAAFPALLLASLLAASYLPKAVAKLRASDIDVELPFFLIYMSTLSIVLTPLQVLEKVSRAPRYVFNQMRYEARRFCVEAKVYGRDPLEALGEVARTTPHKGLGSILEGYVTAVKSGSNPVEYLVKQSELFIRRRVAEIRARVESLVSLMESFISVIIFTVVTLFSLSVSSEALPMLAGQLLTTLRVPKELITLSYVLPLMLSVLFMLLAKSLQPRFPVSEYRQYVPIALSHVVVVVPLVHVFFAPLVAMPRAWMTLPVLISATLLVSSATSAVFDAKYERFYSSIRRGFRDFVRELRELRRVGVPPEKAIDSLSERDYGMFSKYVRLLNEYIKHFRPLKEFMAEFVREVRDWLVISLMFIFIDTIEVGGVTVEVLDRYSTYVDSMFLIESEKRARLKVLKLMPFVTAMIQFFTIYSVLYIFDSIVVSLGRGSLMDRAGPTTFSVLAVTNYIYGLIAGLLSEERLSGGFKYAAILMGITLLSLAFGDYLVRRLFAALGGGL